MATKKEAPPRLSESLTLKLTPHMRKVLRHIAKNNGWSESRTLRTALRDWSRFNINNVWDDNGPEKLR